MAASTTSDAGGVDVKEPSAATMIASGHVTALPIPEPARLASYLSSLTLSSSPPPSFSPSSVRYAVYSSEHQLPYIQSLIDMDLSEPYSIFTYRYFLNNFPHLCFLAMIPNPHPPPPLQPPSPPSSPTSLPPHPHPPDLCIGTIICKLSTHHPRSSSSSSLLPSPLDPRLHRHARHLPPLPPPRRRLPPRRPCPHPHAPTPRRRRRPRNRNSQHRSPPPLRGQRLRPRRAAAQVLPQRGGRVQAQGVVDVGGGEEEEGEGEGEGREKEGGRAKGRSEEEGGGGREGGEGKGREEGDKEEMGRQGEEAGPGGDTRGAIGSDEVFDDEEGDDVDD